ncbi:MAG: hypothetical protein P8J18_00260 [Halieaceae bacterium]|nr:hypothetical protein [Halieaceae bacterium]
MRDLKQMRGIALALVLWFVAAMSLLVAGIVSQARIDIKLAQVHAAQSVAVAAGDGATLLFLADLINEEKSGDQFVLEQSNTYQVGLIKVILKALPSEALLNLRTASVDVLHKLLMKQGIEASKAKMVSENIGSWRNELRYTGRRDSVLKTLEDILLVQGVDRRIYDAFRDYAYVGPVSLNRGDLPSIFMPRFLKDVLIETNSFTEEELNTAPLENVLLSSSRVLRVDAIIEYSGKKWLRRQWVKRGARAGSAIRWKSWRVEPARIYLYQALR